MLVKRTSRMPFGQMLILVTLFAIGAVVATSMQSSAGAAAPQTQAGLPAESGRVETTSVPPTEAPSTEAPASAVPIATIVPMVIGGPTLTEEQILLIEQESAGDDTKCPNGLECGWGELSQPMPSDR